MEEQAFFEEGSVTVTRSRIVIGNQTYPVANITSIRTDTVAPNLLGTFLLGIFGVFLLLFGLSDSVGAFLVGAILLVVAIVRWRQAKATYTIFFGTAGGERRALESEDADYVNRVARAIDQALIAGR